MTKKKPTLKEEIQVLRQEIESSANNQELLEEALSVLETQLQDQGWIKLFGGGKELSKSALNTLYDLGRAYWLKNPLIRRAVEIQALYVFAQGMTIQADHEPVDVVIQRFLKDRKNYNSISSHQAWMQNERDLALSGNLFFALFTTPETGRVIVRTIPFYEIAEIVCNPDDFKEPWFYRREFMITTFDDTTGNTSERTEIQYYPDWKYDPDEKPDQIGSYKVNWDSPVYHVKTNCLPDMKYGVSELYSAIDWSQAYKRFLENWGKLTEAYTRFAWGITTKGGQAKVSAAKARMETLFAKTDPNTDEDLEGTVRTKQLPVGGVFTSTEGVTLNAIRTQGATTSMEDARRLMLMVASASGIPEQILTGDPSTGNLATAKAMERPLELQFRNRQTFWVDTWWDLCQYVIDQAIEAGELPGIKEEDPYTGEITYYLLATPDADDETQKQITRDVTITFPPLLEHDVLQTVQAIISAATIDNKTLAGTMDRKTMAGLLLRALKVENAEGILDTLPEEPQYDRVTAPPTPDTGGYGGFSGIDYTEESLNNLLKDTIKDVQNAARKLQEADDPEGQWVTINGNHILIGKDGTIKSGLGKGKTPEQAFGKGADATTGGKVSGKSTTPPASQERITVADMDMDLSEAVMTKQHNILKRSGHLPRSGDIIDNPTYGRDQQKAVDDYVKSSTDFNYYMRHEEIRVPGGRDKGLLQKEKDRYIKMDAALSSAIEKTPPLPKGLTIYRGVSGESSAKLAKMEVGDICQDKGYASFSYDPQISRNFAEKTIIRIVTDGKTKALPVGGGESEILLKKSTKLKIIQKDSIKIRGRDNPMTLLTGVII